MARPIEGALDFASVPSLLTRMDAIAASGAIDAGSIARVDSAGLAYLLELTRRAKAKHHDFVIRNAPPSLISLATFFGLIGILHFDSSSESPSESSGDPA